MGLLCILSGPRQGVVLISASVLHACRSSLLSRSSAVIFIVSTNTLIVLTFSSTSSCHSSYNIAMFRSIMCSFRGTCLKSYQSRNSPGIYCPKICQFCQGQVARQGSLLLHTHKNVDKTRDSLRAVLTSQQARL